MPLILERRNYYTDDTVIACACLKASRTFKRSSYIDRHHSNFILFMRDTARKEPSLGYGAGFFAWAFSDAYLNCCRLNGTVDLVSGKEAASGLL